MMKFNLSLLFILALVWNLQAQSSKGLGSNDPEAKKVLDEVSSKFRTYKTVQAKFVLKVENGSGKSMGTKSGTVFMKGSKYRISLPDQEIFSDGANVWTMNKEDNEVTITKIDPSGGSLTPQKLFTNFYDKDFLYKLNGLTALNGKKMKEVELTPVDKTKPFFKVLLYVDKSAINTTKIFEKNGNRYTYSTSSFKPNTAIADATFIFDAKKYPGVEVVDLR
ncbi:MAG TPA: outer membrane lipoprotein carrier protein LolA [Ferruginibacter sp.]|jgi:outer membrane lipoprotein-sorting protein|nr:outer membrane lipoprotein carrier protein LolA [Bacteroidota bacterium]MBS1926224.1 outer membrane lipoprotein carrier protein LolA [Bacteroidota bacterium]MCC6692693.1 outer membrane lipoprotein carrier protein LolA [Chitinophagaceae bacterium]HMT96023.1 outer membrane lipoprotein carrier protein LolA [Ferruginibacter sp.]HRD42843.1 outer membrane lipoprotein carrier protein LolA [Ferruginibacter sp.]